MGFRDKLMKKAEGWQADVEAGVTMGMDAAEKEARRRRSALKLELHDGAARAGEKVGVTVHATEDMEDSTFETTLRLVCSSPDHTGTVERVGPVPLHEGPVSAGESWVCEMDLPADAEPDLAVGDIAIQWAIAVGHPYGGGKARYRFSMLGPVTGGVSQPDSSPGEACRSDKLDVVVTASAKEVRRGESIRAQFELGPGIESGAGLEAGLVCTLNWLKDTHDSGEHGGVVETDLTSEWMADWRPLSGSSEIEFEIPVDAPYSVDCKEAGVTWELRAREPKKMRRDPATVAPLRVLA